MEKIETIVIGNLNLELLFQATNDGWIGHVVVSQNHEDSIEEEIIYPDQPSYQSLENLAAALKEKATQRITRI